VEDAGGDVVGFGGRVLPALDYGGFDPPKYLNSPETPLYKKSRVLYGLRHARSEIVQDGAVLVCEGYTDVMALHQADVGNAVATCGTAVGTEHLRTIARYAPRVVLAFDGDAAGVQAAERAWEAARAIAADDGVRLDVHVLLLNDGMDPAEFARQAGAAAVREAIDAAQPVVPFVVDHRLTHADLTTEAGRTAALRDAVEVLAREPDQDLRREWARTVVADRIGVAYDFVVRTADRMGVTIDAHEGVASTTASGRAPAAASREIDRARARRERAVLRVALQSPQLLPDEWFELAADDFTHPRARAIFVALSAAGGAGVAIDAVLEQASDDDERAVIRAVALEEDLELTGRAPGDDESLASMVAAERVRRLLAERLADAEGRLRA
ncbi:MAG: toprim domain-containing protein, partial [Nitriliruptoraceae bacterium]